MQKPKKIRSTLATTEYGSYLEGFWAASKSQTTSSALIINYCHGLRKGLEILTYSASTNNHCHGLRKGLEIQTSSALINNYCHGFKKMLEIQLVSTTCILLVSGFNIPEDIPSSIESAKLSYAL